MRLLPAALSAALLASAPAFAQQSPVVVELYTSQGCVSCPPADALFAEIAEQEGVIALALHVDFWDYYGWKDTFAKRIFTKRQKGYASAMRQRSLFTPQMVIQGEDMVVGRDEATIADRISAHRDKPATVQLTVEREDDRLRIHLEPMAMAIGPADIEVVTLRPSEEVTILGGENAGQTVNYTNIVDDWDTVAQWDGESVFDLEFSGLPDLPVVVIVQRSGFGGILNAARLD